MSILPELLAQIVAISFCFHVKKNKRYKRRAGLALWKETQVDNHLINIEFWKKNPLLSDTHSYIDDTILKYVALADEVWHGILRFGCDRCFKKIKPLRAVYGNIDDAKARMEFPLHNLYVWRCGGVDYALVVTQVNNPAIKRRWLQIHQIIYLWTFTYFEGDVR
jgi:hypothetical protein